MKVIPFPSKKSSKESGNGLSKKAKEIAREHGDKGAFVLTVCQDGDIRLGTDGLTPEELREALCIAIHYSHVFQQEIG